MALSNQWQVRHSKARSVASTRGDESARGARLLADRIRTSIYSQAVAKKMHWKIRKVWVSEELEARTSERSIAKSRAVNGKWRVLKRRGIISCTICIICTHKNVSELFPDIIRKIVYKNSELMIQEINGHESTFDHESTFPILLIENTAMR